MRRYRRYGERARPKGRFIHNQVESNVSLSTAMGNSTVSINLLSAIGTDAKTVLTGAYLHSISGDMVIEASQTNQMVGVAYGLMNWPIGSAVGFVDVEHSEFNYRYWNAIWFLHESNSGPSFRVMPLPRFRPFRINSRFDNPLIFIRSMSENDLVIHYALRTRLWVP